MYFVKYGNEYLHDPRIDKYKLLDLKLDCEENSCGYCDFTIYPDHPMRGKLRERDADNPIEVYDDDILLFAGFIYELGEEFYLEGIVKCKGELDYLSESIVRPYSTQQRGYGLTAPSSINGYFNWLISQHNQHSSPNKQFIVGRNEGSALDKNNYIFRENDKYPTTIDEISDKLLNNENLGGYIVTRHENGKRYIDYFANWTNANAQILDFGVNLSDYTKTDNSENLATCIIPLGAKMSETAYEYDDGYFETEDTVFDSTKEYYTQTENSYSKCSDDLSAFEAGVTYYEYNEANDESNLSLTIVGASSRPGDIDYDISGDMIYCVSAVKKYGLIGTTYENTDIKTQENLIDNGVVALRELISPKRTIEIKAVDMHLANPSMKPIRIGEHVRVRSKPHGLDGYFLCRSIDLDLNNPENSLYILGNTFDTLTGQQNKIINSLNNAINKQFEVAKDISSLTSTIINITNQSATAQAENDDAICALYEMVAEGE